MPNSPQSSEASVTTPPRRHNRTFAVLLTLGASWRLAFMVLGLAQLLNVVALGLYARGASVTK